MSALLTGEIQHLSVWKNVPRIVEIRRVAELFDCGLAEILSFTQTGFLDRRTFLRGHPLIDHLVELLPAFGHLLLGFVHFLCDIAISA